MKIQVVPERDAVKFPFDPFDPTKVWPLQDCPLIDVGALELNKNPESYYAEVEQVGFNPSSIVPGIGFSSDKMLQGRRHPRLRAQQLRRVGGAARFPGGPPGLEGGGDYWNHPGDDNDYYSQPGALFRTMSPVQEKVLIENTAKGMGDTPRKIKIRHITSCMKADQAYGGRMARGARHPGGPGTEELVLSRSDRKEEDRLFDTRSLLKPIAFRISGDWVGDTPPAVRAGDVGSWGTYQLSFCAPESRS